MTKIKGYHDISVELLHATPNPNKLIQTAANITMKRDFAENDKDLSGLIKYLIKANHTSLFEHVNYNFLIKGASRNFLAQLTRHRMASYTSGSQHYQNYSDYGFKIGKEFVNNPDVNKAVQAVTNAYTELIDAGVPKEEARQILPGGMENNVMATMNARALGNFFNLRLCNRNCDEIKIVSEKMYDLANQHFPDYFGNIGADCMVGKCTQGQMKCDNGVYKKI